MILGKWPRTRKANGIGHILRRNCLLKQVIEGKIRGEMEVKIRRGRRRKKLLDDLKDRRGFSNLKKETLDHTMWRHRFGGGFGPVVRQNTEWMKWPTWRTIPFYVFIYIFNSPHVSSTSCSSSGEKNYVNITSGSCRWPCLKQVGGELPTCTRHGHQHRLTATRGCIDTIFLSWWWARCARNM